MGCGCLQSSSTSQVSTFPRVHPPAALCIHIIFVYELQQRGQFREEDSAGRAACRHHAPSSKHKHKRPAYRSSLARKWSNLQSRGITLLRSLVSTWV